MNLRPRFPLLKMLTPLAHRCLMKAISQVGLKSIQMTPLRLLVRCFHSIRSSSSAAIYASPYSSLTPASRRTTSLLSSSLISLTAASPRRHLFIQTQSTPNANSLKFLPGKDVSPGTSYDFSSYREAAKVSPLAALLFGIDGVKSVYLGADLISINIEEGRDWNLIKPEVYACIMDFYASGKPVILEKTEGGETIPVSSTTILPTDSEIVAMIKELIETRIRPAVQEDGGDIDYKGFDEKTGKVLVQMQGSCKGCSSSAITLKNGIENMLRHYVPEVTSVEEFVDEAVESVSEEALKKLEAKLENAKRAEQALPIPTASPN